jgi:hypothetical protein
VILRWEQGRSSIDALLARGRLTRVAPNSELAESMLDQARAHLTSAGLVVETDPTGAFVLAYDSARKALAAILVNQGLRAGGDRAGGSSGSGEVGARGDVDDEVGIQGMGETVENRQVGTVPPASNRATRVAARGMSIVLLVQVG